MNVSRSLLLTLLCTVLFPVAYSLAQDIEIAKESENETTREIPTALEPWKGWVLWNQKDADSPRPFNAINQPIRTWPSRLDLVAAKDGGTWQVDVRVFEEAWVALPGNAKSWPQNVRVGEEQIPVVERRGKPSVKLQPGLHKLSGEFQWKEMPQRIAVPKSIGLLSLKVNDKEIDSPNWDSAGNVWLKRASVEVAEKDMLTVQVYRLLEDGIPLWLRTEIELTVSGKSREEELGNILPKGWQLSVVGSPIPVAVDEQGRVKAQVRAGKWSIQIHAFRNTDLESFQFAPESKPLTKSELIAFRTKPQFRISELEGVRQIDVTQTTFPKQWRNWPVFQWETDGEFKLVEKMRGMGDQRPKGLAIRRNLWLDEDGQALTFRDSVRGNMQQLWRLDVVDEQELGAVRANGQPQLITTNPKTEAHGVEIRTRNLNLDAIGRVARSKNLSAVGWQTEVDSLQLSISLPPGWRMLALFGADNVQGDWLTAWTLLDLFLLLIFSLAVFKLWGFKAGVVALLAFGLAYHEPYSPRFTWLFLLIPIALLRVVPEGTIKRLINGWKWVAVVLLVLFFVPFAVQQIQSALYPQLESAGTTYGQRGGFRLARLAMNNNASFNFETRGVGEGGEVMVGDGKQSGFYVADDVGLSGRGLLDHDDNGNGLFGGEGRALDETVVPQAPMASAPTQELYSQPPSKSSGYLGSASQSIQIGKSQRRGKSQTFNTMQNPLAKVQTGIAIPQWGGSQGRGNRVSGGNVITCSWNGPVTQDQQITPILLSCSMNRLLTVVKLLLLFLLAAIILGVRKINFPAARRGVPAAAVLLAVFFTASTGQAQIPDARMLETLRKRLSEPSDAFPNAADIAKVNLKLDDDQLTMEIEVHAAIEVAVPLPGLLRGWSPRSVKVDGEPNALVCRLPNGYLWVVVPKGVHQVVVEGRLAKSSDWNWTFQLRPRQVTIDAPGWSFTGVRPNGTPERNVFFTRKVKRTQGEATYDQSHFRTIANVDRRLEVGQLWKIKTMVSRESPLGKAISIKVPLMPGENVITSNVEVKDGMVEVNLGAKENHFTWKSEIEPTDEIKLRAFESDQWVERWWLVTSPVWNVTFSGLDPIYRANDNKLSPFWKPWPGEEVTLAFSRPEAVPGETMTVQRVTHVTTLGARQRTIQLNLEVESSLGGDFVIDFDPAAEVTALTIASKSFPVRREGRQLIVPLRPGRQSVKVTYLTSKTLDMVTPVDLVKLPVEGANVTSVVNVPESRWVLWTKGPLRGPAVRFWVIVICAVLVALALGRLPISPLRRFEWVLLVLGLTQVHLFAAMLVIGWLFLLAWRAKQSPDEVSSTRFNFMQIAIVILTVVSLGILVAAVSEGLLGSPDMFIIGNGSTSNSLNWFQPRTGLELPQPMVVSVSVGFYKLLMILWALWLATAVLRWLQQGWNAFSNGGFWKHDAKKNAKPLATEPQVSDDNDLPYEP